MPYNSVASCQVSTVFRHVRSTEETGQQPQSGSGERLLLGKKVEYLVVHRVPCEWVLLKNFNNTNGEWL